MMHQYLSRLILGFILTISVADGLTFQQPPVNISFTFPRPDKPPINVFYPYITRLHDVAWQSVNDQVLREYQLSFNYVNDNDDVNLTRQILRDILYNESLYFLPCCLGYGTLMLDIMTQESLTKPLIAPLDINDELRDMSSNSHVINLLASETEEVATIISYLTVNLQLSRIGYYGPSGNVANIVNQTLEALGRRLVVYREFINTVTPEDMAAIATAAPEAIILTTEAPGTISFIPQLRSFSNDTIVIIPSAQSTTGALNFVLSTEENTRNVLAVASTPTWTNVTQSADTLIGMLQQDLMMYDPNLISDGAPFGFVPGTNEIHAYLAIQWLARVIDTIPAADFNTSVLDAVYSRSVNIVGDQIVGPFLDDCQSILGCCNQAAHAIYINELVPNILGASDYVQIETVTWPGCTASPENQPLPFVLGMVQDLTSENLILAEGIRLALAHKVAESAFNGRGALLLAYDSLIGDLDELTQEIVNTDMALGLLGQTNILSDTDNITVWSLRPNEVADRAEIIRLFPSAQDQLFAALSELSSEFELLTDDSELIDTATSWAKELKLKLVSSSSTVIIYYSNVQDSVQAIQNRDSNDRIYLLGLYEPSDILTDLGSVPSNLVFVLSAPPVGALSGPLILQDYLDETPGNGTQLGFMAYITGRFFSRVLESITGNVNSDRVLSAVYQLGVISEAGLATGKLSLESEDFCNKGLREVYLVPAPDLSTSDSTTWSGCDASPEAKTGSDGDNNEEVGIATGVSLAALFLLCCCCLLLLCLVCSALLVILTLTASLVRRSSQDVIKLTPPDYRQLAFKTIQESGDGDEAHTALLYDHNITKSEMDHCLRLFSRMLLETPYNRLLIETLDAKSNKSRQIPSWLLYVYRYEGYETQLIEILSESVVSKLTGVTTMFREDSILARVFKVFCQLEGLPFLWQKLARIVNEIELAATGARKLNIEMPSDNDADVFSLEMEVDPMKAEHKTEADLAVNSYQLKALAQKIFNSVTTKFPASISAFVRLISTAVTEQFPDVDPDHLRVLAGSFVFLRYVCPAITAPQMWGLLTDNPSPKSQRTFVLLSKILQNLANGRTFDKEAYMTSINDFITDNRDSMRSFLQSVVNDVDDFEDVMIDSSGLEVPKSVYETALKSLLAASLDCKADILRVFNSKLTLDEMGSAKTEYLYELGLAEE